MSGYCEIVVKGELDTNWSAWLGGLTIEHQPNGETRIHGQLRDQAAFYGLLIKVRDIALLLISVKYNVDESPAEKTEQPALHN